MRRSLEMRSAGQNGAYEDHKGSHGVDDENVGQGEAVVGCEVVVLLVGRIKFIYRGQPDVARTTYQPTYLYRNQSSGWSSILPCQSCSIQKRQS